MTTQTTQLAPVADAMPTNAPVTPLVLITRAVESGAGIEVMEKLMALHERWEANQSRKAFDAAISAAKSEIPVINKNRQVGFAHKTGNDSTEYWHEDLGEIARTVDPILSRHGLSYRFRSAQSDGRVSVTCILSHRDGHAEETTLDAAPDASGKKNSIQQVGSAITYLQRYTLKLALGLAASKDDDGAEADGPELITDDQRKELLDMADTAGADIAKFCDYFKIESVAALPVQHFEQAKTMLTAKAAKAKK